MLNKDKFGIIANTVPLINKHLQYKQDLSLDNIETAYKTAEQEQITYIESKANKITTVKDLALLFRDSCLSFAALGERAGLLIDKVNGHIADPKVALDTALRKDIKDKTDTNEGTYVFDKLPLGCGYDNADGVDHIVSAAYDQSNGLTVADTIDSRVLYLPILLQYLDSIGSTLDIQLDENIVDYVYMIISDSRWQTRPLLGYYNDEYGYQRVTNKEFVDIFANRAKTIIEDTMTQEPEYYEVLQIKRILHKKLASVYFGTTVSALYIYSDLAKILYAVGQGKIITNKAIEALGCYISRDSSVLVANRSLKEEVYEINKVGLLSYAEALEILDLSDLTGVAEIKSLIKKYCI